MTGPRRLFAAAAVALIAGVGGTACGGQGDSPSAATQPGGQDVVTGDTLPETSPDAPFCTSIGAIQGLGAGQPAAATREKVLAQNEQLLDLLDEASAVVPDGAPADVEALFDDYRTIAQAIGAAGGNVDAAYQTLQETDPAVAARLFKATAHLPAFEFFARRCNIRFG